MGRIDVVTVRPTGYVHVDALSELEETVHFGIRALGYSVGRVSWSSWTCRLGKLLPYPAVVIGGHLMNQEQVERVPENATIYNTEQFGAGYGMITSAYLDLLRNRQVWDVNPGPYDYVSKHRVKYVPVGYVPEMTRIISAKDPDIDVLFYGSMSGRRAHILDELTRRGLKTRYLFGVYGAERDAYIARAKVVLSMHYAEGGQLEGVRVAYLLANSKAVVAEGWGLSAKRSPERELSVAYGELAEACARLVERPHPRRMWETLGFDLIRRMPETDILRTALELPA